MRVLYQIFKGFSDVSIDEPAMLFYGDDFEDINLLNISYRDYNSTL